MIRWKPVLVLIAAVVAAGCSGIPRRERDQEQLVKHWRCQISQIRPIDYLQLKRDQRAERAQQAEQSQR